MRQPWVTTDHAAEFAAELVRRTGAPLDPATLDAAESLIDALGGPRSPLVGSGATFARTMASALAAIAAVPRPTRPAAPTDPTEPSEPAAPLREDHA